MSNKNKILVKVHESYRKVVAISDAELLGKHFKQGNLQLDVNKHFYEGQEMTEEEVVKLIKALEKDSPSYNILGQRAIALCIKENLIQEQGIKKISGIPHAMVF